MKTIKWALCLAAILAASFVTATWSRTVLAVSSADKAAGNSEVKIDNFSFGPPDIAIPAGSTVTWTNNDDVPHVVASDDNVFKSKALDTDDRFSFTFTKPGTYNYYCAIHPKMTAKIIVQ